MAAGLGFKDFTTGEVLTAADVDGYLMQGVWVFASAAARDAAVTSPQEGNFAYLKDTNVTTYYTGSAWANLDTTGMTNPMTTTGDTIYSSSGSTPARLGIGSTGDVLTVAGGVPSWAAPASGGGMTLLSTTSLTSGSSVTISSISQSYKHLLLLISDVTTTSDHYMVVKPNNTSDLKGHYIEARAAANINYNSKSDIPLNDATAQKASGGNSSSAIDFYNYTSTTLKKHVRASYFYITGGDVNGSGHVYGTFTTSAISSINLSTNSTFTAGTALLYGVS